MNVEKNQSRSAAPKVWFGCAGAALLSFLGLAWLVSHEQTQVWDLAIRQAVHNYAAPELTRWMSRISRIGAYGLIRFAILALLVVLPFFRRTREGLFLAMSVGGGLILEIWLKLVFHRHRPEAFFGYPDPGNYSFPSGHAIFAVCFYGILALLLAEEFEKPLYRYIVLTGGGILIFLIGLSRVYLGVHYPSDVLGGFAVASAWVCLLRAVYKSLPRRGQTRMDTDKGK